MNTQTTGAGCANQPAPSCEDPGQRAYRLKMEAETRLINAQARQLELDNAECAPVVDVKPFVANCEPVKSCPAIVMDFIPLGGGLTVRAALEALRLGYTIARPSWGVAVTLLEEDREATDWEIVDTPVEVEEPKKEEARDEPTK